MLTPAQVAALRDKVGHVTDSLVDFLIADIAERISEAGQFTNTAAYEAWRAQKLGLSQKELKKELQKRLKLSTAEINQLFTQVAQTSYSNDIKRLGAKAVAFEENTSLQQILDSTVKLAQDDFTNITQTMGFVGPDGRFHELTEAYQRSCDFAFEKVANGAQDYNSAVRDATRELAKRGIRVMDYDSGVHTSMEAAVRRNIMGGLGLMNEQIAQQNHDDLGCDGWEISAHGGCAPDHEPIQGKQYSDAEYARLNNSLVRRIGTLNCGHSSMPIILGVNEPQYTKEELEEFRQQNEEGITYDGKHYTLYEAGQRQSNLETAIRNRKRRILIDEKLGDKDALQHDQIRLQLLKQEYSRFSKAANLPMRHERMEAAGFDWKKGKAAENAMLSIAQMAKANEVDNDWSQTLPKPVSKEEKASIIQYAASKGIKIPGLRNFDGESELLRSGVDALSQVSEVFPTNQKLVLSVSHSLSSEDFAVTVGNHITINGKILRNRKITEFNISNGSSFASSTLEDVFVHEYGHVLSNNKGQKGIEIARKACYNLYGRDFETDELLDFLRSNVSIYSTTYTTKSNGQPSYDPKRFREVIPEVLAKNNSKANEFTSEFLRLLKEVSE